MQWRHMAQAIRRTGVLQDEEWDRAPAAFPFVIPENSIKCSLILRCVGIHEAFPAKPPKFQLASWEGIGSLRLQPTSRGNPWQRSPSTRTLHVPPGAQCTHDEQCMLHPTNSALYTPDVRAQSPKWRRSPFLRAAACALEPPQAMRKVSGIPIFAGRSLFGCAWACTCGGPADRGGPSSSSGPSTPVAFAPPMFSPREWNAECHTARAMSPSFTSAMREGCPYGAALWLFATPLQGPDMVGATSPFFEPPLPGHPTARTGNCYSSSCVAIPCLPKLAAPTGSVLSCPPWHRPPDTARADVNQLRDAEAPSTRGRGVQAGSVWPCALLLVFYVRVCVCVCMCIAMCMRLPRAAQQRWPIDSPLHVPLSVPCR